MKSPAIILFRRLDRGEGKVKGLSRLQTARRLAQEESSQRGEWGSGGMAAAAEEDEEAGRRWRCRAVVRKAEELVASAMAGRDSSHDAAHAFRVRDLALSLAREEEEEEEEEQQQEQQQRQHASASASNNNDNSCSSSSSSISLEIVELAALLHDIGDYKYTKNGVEDTTIVEKFLEGEGLEEAKRDKILTIIKGMGFKNEVSRVQLADSSLEFGIVQDADRLDAIGAIGIARCFTYGGSKGHILHDPEILPRQDLSKEKYMGKDEKQTTVNHFHEKLFKLKGLMKTNAGKRRAIKRHQFMQEFLTEFYEEWSGRA